MKLLITYLLFSALVFAQTFKAEKVTGDVQVLKGSSENYVPVKSGDELSGRDMIITSEHGSVQLKNGKERFVLKNNSALDLNSIRKLSINELLLALAMEEIRRVPVKDDSELKSTAVYGSSKSSNKLKAIESSGIGFKKLNGARQLAENGFNESAVLAEREVLRKHPETQNAASDRIYFAGIFEKLNLNDEAYNEYSAIYNLKLNPDQKKFVSEKIEALLKK